MMPKYYDRSGAEITQKVWIQLYNMLDYVTLGRVQIGPWTISTVWLGVDHRFGHAGDPIIFESMVFGPEPFDDFQMRYAFEGDAIMGHDIIVEEVQRHYDASTV